MAASKSINFIAGLAGLMLLSACTEAKLAVHGVKVMTRYNTQAEGVGESPQGTFKIGQPYEIDGIWYYPAVDPTYDEIGIASWYGQEFHGRPTANGGRYDMNALTAAHRTLPMPTKVRVTNLENGRSLILTVNDRGPFAKGRILDASRAAADALGFLETGTAKVRVTVLEADDITRQASAPARAPAPTVVLTAEEGGDISVVSEADMILPRKQIYIQVAAFKNEETASQFAGAMAPYGPALVKSLQKPDMTLFRVRLGPLENVDQADATLARLATDGYSEARMVID